MTRLDYKWHAWFAWRPVRTLKGIVWLETVDRCWSGFGWLYRTRRKPPVGYWNGRAYRERQCAPRENTCHTCAFSPITCVENGQWFAMRNAFGDNCMKRAVVYVRAE
ncbi:MAG: hypothetical protein KGJ38_08285 [Burkholderiaceae bacterium]|nr:hypothetical protein [Burkholderiaceae bacterium]